MRVYIKRLICMACAALLMLSLCACSVNTEPDVTDELPQQEDTTPTPTETPAVTPFETVEESYTITASDECLDDYIDSCSVYKDRYDAMRNHNVDYTFTHTFPTGEVETEVKTVTLRTERSCDHVWKEEGGYVFDSHEDGEIYALPEYEAECQIEEGSVDTMVDYVYDRVYYYTDSEGQQQTITQTIHTETVRTCTHLPQVTDAE